MKLMAEYIYSGLKHIQYDGTDADILKNKFPMLSHEIIKRLCQWLIDNNQVIDAFDCYDAQSGWRGTEFRIGKADLSCNGYCLKDSNVELFLNGGQNPMWYNISQPEYEYAKRWQQINFKNDL